MLEEHERLADALGPRRANEIFAEGLKQRGTQEVSQLRTRHRAERDRGQDRATRRAPARSLKPAQLEGKNPDQQRAERKIRQRDAERRNRRTDTVDPAVDRKSVV